MSVFTTDGGSNRGLSVASQDKPIDLGQQDVTLLNLWHTLKASRFYGVGYSSSPIRVSIKEKGLGKDTKYWRVLPDFTNTGMLQVSNVPLSGSDITPHLISKDVVTAGVGEEIFLYRFFTLLSPSPLTYISYSATRGWIDTTNSTGTQVVKDTGNGVWSLWGHGVGVGVDYSLQDIPRELDIMSIIGSIHAASGEPKGTILPANIIAALGAATAPDIDNFFQTKTAVENKIAVLKGILDQSILDVDGKVTTNRNTIGDVSTAVGNLSTSFTNFETATTTILGTARGSFTTIDGRLTKDEQDIGDNTSAVSSLKVEVNDLILQAAGVFGAQIQTNNINSKSTSASFTNGILDNVPDDFVPIDGGEVLVGVNPDSGWLTRDGNAVLVNHIETWNATTSKWIETEPTGDKRKVFLSVPRVDSSGNFVKQNGKTVYDIVFCYFQNDEWERQGNIEELSNFYKALKARVDLIEPKLTDCLTRITTNESAIRVMGTVVDGVVASQTNLILKAAGTYLILSQSRIVKVSDTQGTITASHAITDGFWYWSRTNKGLYEFKNGAGVALEIVASDEKNRYLTELLESGVAIPAYSTTIEGHAYGKKGSNIIYVTPSTGTDWATETLAEKTLVSVISGDNEGIWEVVGTTWTRQQIFDFSQLTDADIASLKQRMTDVEGVADKNKTALALINTNLDLKENAVDRIETSPSGIGSDIGRFVILTPTLRLRKVYVANPLFPTVKVYKQIDMVEGQRFYNKADRKVWIVKGGVPVVQQQLTDAQLASIVNALPLATGTNFLITKTALATALQNITNGNGWTPRIQFYSNTAGDKQYLKIFDWFGGSGTKPLVGFIGEGTALLQNTTGATNLKGEKGDSTGGTGSGAASFFLKFIAKHDVGTFPDLPDGSYIIQNEANGFRVWKYVDGAPEDQRITLDVGECFISMDADSPPKIAFFRRDSNGVKEIFVETGSSSGGTSTESLSILFVDKINVSASALLTTPDGYRFMTDDFGIYKVVNSVAVKQGDLEIGYAILAQDDAHPNSKAFFKRIADSAVPVKVVDIDNVSSFESNLGDTVLKLHSGINIPHVQNIYILTSGFEIAENITDGANSLANLPSGLNIPSQLYVTVITNFAFNHPIASSNVVGNPISLPLDHFNAIPLGTWETILLGFVVIPEGQGGTLGLVTGDFSLQATNYGGGNYLSIRITSQFMGRNASRGYSLGQTFKISDLSIRFGVTGLGASAVSTLITGTTLVTQAIKDLYYSLDATTYIQRDSAERYAPIHLSSGAVVSRALAPLTIDPGSVQTTTDGETLITVPAGTDITRSWIAVARSGQAYDQNHLFKIESMRDNVIVIKSLLPHFTDNPWLLTLCDIHGIPSPTPYGEYFVYADDLFHEDPTYTHAPDVIVNIDPFDTVKGTTHVTTDSALATPYHRHGIWNGDPSKYCVIINYEGIHENEIVGTAILGTTDYNDYLDGYSESDNKGSLTTQTGTLAGINFHSLIVSHFGGVYTLVIVIEKVDLVGEPVDLAGRILRFAYGSTNIVLGDVNVPAKNEALPDAPTNRYEILLTRDIFRLSATVAPRNPITVQELKTTGAQFWVKGEITGNPSTITPVKMVVDGLKKALAENIGGDGVLVAKESFTFGRRTDPRITSVTANPSTVLLQFDTPFHYYNYSEIFILSSLLSTDDNRPIWKLVNLNRNGLPDDDQTVYGTIQATKYGQQKYGYLPNVNIADDPNGETASHILGTHTRFTIGWKTGQTRTLVAEERGPWLVPEIVAQGVSGDSLMYVSGGTLSYAFPDNKAYVHDLIHSLTVWIRCQGKNDFITFHRSLNYNSRIYGISGCSLQLQHSLINYIDYINGIKILPIVGTSSIIYLHSVDITLLKYPDPTSI